MAYASLMSAVCQLYIRCISAVCQPYIRCISAVSQLYISGISVVCQPYPISQFARKIINFLKVSQIISAAVANDYFFWMTSVWLYDPESPLQHFRCFLANFFFFHICCMSSIYCHMYFFCVRTDFNHYPVSQYISGHEI